MLRAAKLLPLALAIACIAGWGVRTPAIVLIDDPDLIGKGGRGDANGDLVVDVSDSMYLSNWLFNGGPEPPCMNAADVNDDSVVDISDPMYLNNWLFNGGPPPPAPGPSNPNCDPDPTPPFLGCHEAYCD